MGKLLSCLEYYIGKSGRSKGVKRYYLWEVYTSIKESFDKPFDKITSIIEAKDGILLQIGSTSYSIIVPTHSEFIKVFNMAKNVGKE